MDIDKLFKVPKLPSSGSKRRMPDNPTPAVLKKMKMDALLEPSDSPPVTSAHGKRVARVTVEEEGDEDAEMPAADFAPGGDADYFVEEDEEGRFYGGGLTTEQKDILNIFDGAGVEGVQEDVEDLNTSGVRKLLVRFERAVNKNQDQRSKHPDDPSKFIDSEADLDVAIKALLPLAQVPTLAFPELVRSGTVSHLTGLLSHENPDIVIDVVEVIHELTDEDVGNEVDDGDDSSREEALNALVGGLLGHSILELLVDNLSRLNETEESDRQGVFHVLGIFENVLGFNAELSKDLVAKTTILEWILKRIQAKSHDENRGYAAEILSILLQNSRPNRLVLVKLDGVDALLRVLSNYRRRDPAGADETEFMENIFDCLCSALAEHEAKKAFLDSEGVDLMLIMMKERMQARSRSIKVLDHAMSGSAGAPACETFVEALGLKTLFSTLMGKTKNQKSTTTASEDTSHTLGIISSLFTNLASESVARLRLLAKFVEADYEKVDKLLDIRDAAQSRLVVVDREIEEEKELQAQEEETEEEDVWYIRRLDGGLFTLQTVGYILGWIVMEDDGIRSHVQRMLDRRNKSLKDIANTLRVYYDNVDETEPTGDDTLQLSQRDILHNLIAFLDAC